MTHLVAVGGSDAGIAAALRARELDRLMEQRKFYRHQAGDSRIPACDGVEKYFLGVAAPILSQGDLMGCVMLLSQEQETLPTEGDLQLAQTAAAFLGKQMES